MFVVGMALIVGGVAGVTHRVPAPSRTPPDETQLTSTRPGTSTAPDSSFSGTPETGVIIAPPSSTRGAASNPSAFPVETTAASTPATGPSRTTAPTLAALPGMPSPPAPPPLGQLPLPELLALLQVASEDRTGYDRALFPHWIDADSNGCDTRREVLLAEAVDPPSIGAGCYLIGGRWVSLYDGIETTDPSTFDIDHVVALAEAWDSGASAWSLERRTRFANDLGVEWSLIAVSANSNRSKSDRDPTNWLPPMASARCEYLGMWLGVKVRWRLSIDAIERTSIDHDITGCTQRMAIALAP